VAGHRTGVAEREVDVGVPVHVGDPVAPCVVEVEREATAPLVHPGHRHLAEQVGALLEQLAAARVALRVGGLLHGEQLGETGTVEVRHGANAIATDAVRNSPDPPSDQSADRPMACGIRRDAGPPHQRA